MPDKLIIIGAGGVGREVAAVLKRHPLRQHELIGFIDDNIKPGTIINGIEVLGGMLWIKDNYNGLGVIIAIGNPQVRKAIVGSLKEFKISYPTLIHPNVNIHETETVTIGQGCYIADGCILTTDIV